MPRYLETPWGQELEVPDDATEDQIRLKIRDIEKDRQRAEVTAGKQREQARAYPTTPPDPTMEMDPLARIGISDPRYALAVAAGDPAQRTKVARHLPGMVGAGAGAAVRGAGLLARMGLSEAGMEAGEALGAAAVGEDPAAAAKAVRGYGAGGEAAAAALSPLLRGVLAPFASKVTAEGKEAVRTLGVVGARPTPAQVSSSRALDVIENIGEASLFGGGRVRLAKEAAGQAGEALVRGVPAGMPGRGGKVLKQAFEQLDVLGKDVPVQIDDVAAEAQRLLAERGLAKSDQFIGAVKQIAEYGKKPRDLPEWLEAFAPVPEKEILDFNKIRQIRSDLLDLGRKEVGGLASKNERGAVRRLAGMLREHLDEAATKVPGLSEAYKTANTATRLAETREIFEKMLTKAQVAKGGGPPVLSGDILRRGLVRMDPSLRKYLHPDALKRFERLAGVLQTAQSKSPDATGRVMVQLTQAAAVGGIVTGTAKAAAQATLVIPYIFARASTSPRMFRYLTTGLRAPETKKGGAAIAALLKSLQEEED